MKTEKYRVTGMTCAACQANVTRCVQKLAGVQEVAVSLLSNEMTLTRDEALLSPQEISAAVSGIGYGAALLGGEAKGGGDGFRGEWQERQSAAQQERASMKRRLISSIALLLPLMYIAMGGMLGLPLPTILSGMDNSLINAFTQLLIALAVIYINRKFFIVGFRALAHRAPNMDSLVATGSAAALFYGIFAMYMMMYGFGRGDMSIVHRYAHELYFESSAMILTLVTVGKYLEARSKAKTSDALGKLVDLAPKTATVIRGETELEIPAEQLAAGDIVVIRPGGSIPADGVITEGRGYIDEAAITGESIPVEKGEGDSVISATINKNGSFRFCAQRVGDDTTLAQIIRLVDEAGNSKAPIARLADKVSGVFVPVVIGIAAVTAAVWLISGSGFEFALARAISVLVISCPCALGLATPVAIMVGTGRAAEYGILIKSAQSLERLHDIDTIALDKTGTITSGKPQVTDIVVTAAGMSEGELLAFAATAEVGSEHPLAAAVVERARAQGVPFGAADSFEAEAGRGVRAVIGGRRWLAGNMSFMLESGVAASQAAEAAVERLAGEGKTPLIFALEGDTVGVIAVADAVRESSRAAIERFREMGLRVVMLTGDNAVTAEAIRALLGIEEAVSGVLPTEKEAHIRAIQGGGGRVAMVGDGINDAPALIRADVGIAIGAGTDIAIDSADVVLMRDSLGDAATAVSLGRAVVRNIKMNLFWAFFYNVLGIPIAAGVLYPAFGIALSPMLGAAAMSLSSVCVVSNALRLRRFGKGRGQEQPQKDYAAPESGDTEIKTDTIIQEEKAMKKIVTVQGMMCAHCQAHVKQALEAVAGVSAAEVDLASGRAEVTLASEVADFALADAVQAAGYTAVSVSEG